MTTKDILAFLEDYYSDARQFAFFKELRIGTGYRKYNRKSGIYEEDNPEQRIDAWIINCYESKKFEKIAFEIKVSRSDFLHEIKNPQKRKQAMKVCNLFYFVAPKGLIKVDEVPDDCGLIEISESGRFNWTKKVPWRDTEPPSWKFIASLARRVTKLDKRKIIVRRV